MVLAVVLLTTGIKEDTSKTDDILAGVEKIPEPSQSAALEQEPGESKSAEEETVPEEEAALTEGALEKAEAMEEEGAEEQERAPLLNIPAWTNTGSVKYAQRAEYGERNPDGSWKKCQTGAEI